MSRIVRRTAIGIPAVKQYILTATVDDKLPNIYKGQRPRSEEETGEDGRGEESERERERERESELRETKF